MSEATHETHDLSMDDIIVPVQQMFPNCRKYKKCCTKDKDFWVGLQEKVKADKPRLQPFRTKMVLPSPSRMAKPFKHAPVEF